ncbi:MAG: hypothetical protein OXI71_17685 [Gemmatimonadota bacterium]|nr:hypothetical protein [Gemmatimonadota bacterium]
MDEKTDREKARQSRPAMYPLPDPIPDTPENIARAILSTPPKKRDDWQHVQEREANSG